MHDEIRLKLLISISVICFVALVAQSYYVYQSSGRSTGVAQSQESIPASIQERLAEHMAKPDRIDNPNIQQAFGFGSGVDQFQLMQNQIDRLFNSFAPSLGNSFGPGVNGFNSFLSQPQPALDLVETPEEYIVSLERSPGEDVQLETNIENKLLTIQGTIETEMIDTAKGRSLSSASLRQFSQSLPLSSEIDEYGITTTYNEDKIVVRVPKKIS